LQQGTAEDAKRTANGALMAIQMLEMARSSGMGLSEADMVSGVKAAMPTSPPVALAQSWAAASLLVTLFRRELVAHPAATGELLNRFHLPLKLEAHGATLPWAAAVQVYSAAREARVPVVAQPPSKASLMVWALARGGFVGEANGLYEECAASGRFRSVEASMRANLALYTSLSPTTWQQAMKMIRHQVVRKDLLLSTAIAALFQTISHHGNWLGAVSLLHVVLSQDKLAANIQRVKAHAEAQAAAASAKTLAAAASTDSWAQLQDGLVFDAVLRGVRAIHSVSERAAITVLLQLTVAHANMITSPNGKKLARVIMDTIPWSSVDIVKDLSVPLGVPLSNAPRSSPTPVQQHGAAPQTKGTRRPSMYQASTPALYMASNFGDPEVHAAVHELASMSDWTAAIRTYNQHSGRLRPQDTARFRTIVLSTLRQCRGPWTMALALLRLDRRVQLKDAKDDVTRVLATMADAQVDWRVCLGVFEAARAQNAIVPWTVTKVLMSLPSWNVALGLLRSFAVETRFIDVMTPPGAEVYSRVADLCLRSGRTAEGNACVEALVAAGGQLSQNLIRTVPLPLIQKCASAGAMRAPALCPAFRVDSDWQRSVEVLRIVTRVASRPARQREQRASVFFFVVGHRGELDGRPSGPAASGGAAERRAGAVPRAAEPDPVGGVDRACCSVVEATQLRTRFGGERDRVLYAAASTVVKRRAVLRGGLSGGREPASGRVRHPSRDAPPAGALLRFIPQPADTPPAPPRR
jgi:hypothetical protein